MIQVHLHSQVRRSDRVDNPVCIGLAVEEIAWDVADVDWLDYDVATGLCGLAGGKGEVLFIGVVQDRIGGILGSDTRHDVNAWAIKRGSVFERGGDCVLKLTLSTRERSKTAFLSVPVSRWCVEQCLRNAGCFPPLGDFAGWPFIREEELDTLETVASGGGESFRERDLGIHHRQVGGEIRHSFSRQSRSRTLPS